MEVNNLLSLLRLLFLLCLLFLGFWYFAWNLYWPKNIINTKTENRISPLPPQKIKIFKGLRMSNLIPSQDIAVLSRKFLCYGNNINGNRSTPSVINGIFALLSGNMHYCAKHLCQIQWISPWNIVVEVCWIEILEKGFIFSSPWLNPI